MVIYSMTGYDMTGRESGTRSAAVTCFPRKKTVLPQTQDHWLIAFENKLRSDTYRNVPGFLPGTAAPVDIIAYPAAVRYVLFFVAQCPGKTAQNGKYPGAIPRKTYCCCITFNRKPALWCNTAHDPWLQKSTARTG